MKNTTIILFALVIGFITSLFSSATPMPDEIKPDVGINSERKLLINQNRVLKSEILMKSKILKTEQDSILKSKNR